MSRHSEVAWRRYEPYVKLYAQTYPEDCSVNTGEVSTETFTCRLRDAVNGCLKYGYSTDIPENILRDISVKVLDADEKRVAICRKSRAKSLAVVVSEGAQIDLTKLKFEYIPAALQNLVWFVQNECINELKVITPITTDIIPSTDNTYSVELASTQFTRTWRIARI